MSIPPLRLAAVTSHPRHALVAQLALVLNELGSLVDSHQFSNLALAVHFEISRHNVPKLRASLLALPMSLSNSSLEVLQALERAEASDLSPDLLGSLNVTFVHQEPDLHLHIPAVPG